MSSNNTDRDVWATRVLNWAAPRWNVRVRDLDGWSPACVHGGDGQQVHQMPLSAYVIFGAEEEMPFSVYAALFNGSTATAQLTVSWCTDISTHRALRQGASVVLADDLDEDVKLLRALLIEFLAINQDKRVGDIVPNAARRGWADFVCVKLCQLTPKMQMRVFMLVVETSNYGTMTQARYEALLADFSSITEGAAGIDRPGVLPTKKVADMNEVAAAAASGTRLIDLLYTIAFALAPMFAGGQKSRGVSGDMEHDYVTRAFDAWPVKYETPCEVEYAFWDAEKPRLLFYWEPETDVTGRGRTVLFEILLDQSSRFADVQLDRDLCAVRGACDHEHHSDDDEECACGECDREQCSDEDCSCDES